MAFSRREAYLIADDLRKCIEEQLIGSLGGVPQGFDSCVVPGSITWDNCCPGSLRLTVLRQYPTAQFPDLPFRPTPCDGWQRATEIQAVVLRCSPGPNPDGDPPTCERLDAAAQVQAEDYDALWRGTHCCFRNTEFEYMIRSIDAVGPNGQCVGVSMVVVIGLTNWCCCEGC